MELNEIAEHWSNCANEFKHDVRATTKTRTIKDLEVAALCRAFQNTAFFARQAGCRVLEVGCGNAHNCFMLSGLLPHFTFTGVDFIPEMIVSANEIKASDSRFAALTFVVGNVLSLDDCVGLEAEYDIVFTDRCLINLNSHELQRNALDQLCRKTAPGGNVILIENVQQTYGKQNRLRQSVGLAARTPDAYNLFIDEASFLSHAEAVLDLVEVDDFASLHDLLLYVLVPMLNNGDTDYDSPLVKAATQLLLSAPESFRRQFGDFGQNRLYVFKKKAAHG